ncbi:MAG: tripartite tricarboxylate transporter substrate binding protein [Betaproteobacteria bacterium]|nr:MAG: tripartite tricarboxylate transporter substrate binding protein [Betaproteobacteria bacterium]
MFRIIKAILIAALLVVSTASSAQSYPSKPIHIIVPYPAGGTSDILARTIGQRLSESFGQPVIVENKPGANGNVGADLVAKAPADGYTLLLADIGALVISPSVYPTLPFDPVKDFAPVTMVAYSPHILVVHPSVQAASVKELVGLAKSKPGKLNFAISGVGGAPHLAGVDFAMRTGIDWTYIPYKGGAQAIADVAGGQADVTLNGMLATYPLVQGGKLKLLAVSSAKRMSAIPDVPTIAESGVPDFESGSWQGVVVPAGTPREVVTRLNSEILRIVNAPEMRDRLGKQGADVRTNTPEEFGTFIRSETAKWAKVVKDANIKVD